jgi:hypothetical protein
MLTRTSAFAILALAFGAEPAHATLQLSINANGATFTCFDGELSCDQSGGAKNLLTVDTTVGGAFVQLTLAQSSTHPNVLELSSSNILNERAVPITISLLASDTGFAAPVTFIEESASLTFNSAVGSGLSSLEFWADPANAQGANPLNTPGVLLDDVFGAPLTDPASFSGTKLSAFAASDPFSMTEGATLNLIGGASVTGFNQSMQSGVPEPSTWAMLALAGAGGHAQAPTSVLGLLKQSYDGLEERGHGSAVLLHRRNSLLSPCRQAPRRQFIDQRLRRCALY